MLKNTPQKEQGVEFLLALQQKQPHLSDIYERYVNCEMGDPIFGLRQLRDTVYSRGLGMMSRP